MRTTMRKEAVLDGDAIARTFEVVLEKVLTSVETLVGTNSSNFANGFARLTVRLHGLLKLF